MKATKLVLLAALAGVSITGSAEQRKLTEEERAAKLAEWVRLSPEEREKRMYRGTGGFIETRDSRKGKVAIVSCQDKVPDGVIADVAKRISNDSRMNFEFMKRQPAMPEQILKDTGAAAVVVVVDSPDQPISLVALEDRWAIVNVAKIGRNLKTDEARAKFVPSRTAKEVSRCAAVLCGGTRSQFRGNVMDVKRLEDLDLIEDGLPMDRIAAMQEFLQAYGMTQLRRVPYRKACEEGWAPQPTNDVQKAIWDKVREIPSKPIKIEYNEKRDKGK